MEHLSRGMPPPDFDREGWLYLSDRNLPATRPIQTDATSCSVLAVFTIEHFLRYGVWPVASQTFRQANVPQLREYMIWTLMTASQSVESSALFLPFTYGDLNEEVCERLRIAANSRDRIAREQEAESLAIAVSKRQQDEHARKAVARCNAPPSQTLVARFDEAFPTGRRPNQRVCEVKAFDSEPQPPGRSGLRHRLSYSIGDIPLSRIKFACLQRDSKIWLNDEVSQNLVRYLNYSIMVCLFN
jgi:hypothetical protein